MCLNLICYKRRLVKGVCSLAVLPPDADINVVEAKAYKGVLFVPQGIRTIESNSFDDLSNIDTVLLPKSVHCIRKDAFVGIKKVILATDTQLEDMIFEKGWDNGVQAISIGETVRSVFSRLALCVSTLLEGVN